MRFAVGFDAMGDYNIRRFWVRLTQPCMDGCAWEPAGKGDRFIIGCAPFPGVEFRDAGFVQAGFWAGCKGPVGRGVGVRDSALVIGVRHFINKYQAEEGIKKTCAEDDLCSSS